MEMYNHKVSPVLEYQPLIGLYSATGGLWVGGGTAIKQLERLQSDAFLAPMRCKGRFEDFINKLPVRALVDPDAGLFSAACRARMLAGCLQ